MLAVGGQGHNSPELSSGVFVVSEDKKLIYQWEKFSSSVLSEETSAGSFRLEGSGEVAAEF